MRLNFWWMVTTTNKPVVILFFLSSFLVFCYGLAPKWPAWYHKPKIIKMIPNLVKHSGLFVNRITNDAFSQYFNFLSSWALCNVSTPEISLVSKFQSRLTNRKQNSSANQKAAYVKYGAQNFILKWGECSWVWPLLCLLVPLLSL